MYCECHLNMTLVHLHPDVPEHLQPLPEAVNGPHILQGVHHHSRPQEIGGLMSK